MMRQLNIAITGGSDGLGLELSKYFSEKHQARVATCGTRVISSSHPNIFYKSIDLKVENGPQEFLNFIYSTLGYVDIFINNAVSFQDENILTDNRNFIQKQFLLNTIVPLELVQGLNMQISGRSSSYSENTSVIMINSETAIQPKASQATYSATKSALLSYSKSLAMILKSSKISVCSLILGPLGTSYYLDLYKTAAEKFSKTPEEFIEEALKKTFPSHTHSKLITIEEVAKTILFLHNLGASKNGAAWRLDAGVIPIAA